MAVVAIVAGATTAFFNDTETSTGNTFTAGAIDLGIDNTSYYNGVFNDETSWHLTYDMNENDEGGHLFFDFDDLKPGDWGEDTISLHVKNNDSWLCADVTLTSNDDNSSTEPELETGDAEDEDSDFWDGELAQHLKWYWWADDGDNVYEEHESLIHSAVSFPDSDEPKTFTVALADSDTNIWGDEGPVNACDGENDEDCSDDIRYIAKAWCFGDSDFQPYAEDTTGPDVRPVRCDGSGEGNETQTDGMTMDVSFYAEQSRNNDGFVCGDRELDVLPN